MIEEGLRLIELVEKRADGDLVRGILAFVAEASPPARMLRPMRFRAMSTSVRGPAQNTAPSRRCAQLHKL